MIKISLCLFALAIGGLSMTTALNYEGSWIVYLLFTVAANALLLNGFRRSALYFDTFIGVFLWLGFWLKFTLRVAFMNGIFHEPTGQFDGSGAAIDLALLISSCAFIALLLASFIRTRIFRYPDAAPSVSQSGLFLFYQKYRASLLLIFILLVAVIAISNLWLGIYQRGMVAQTVLPFGLNGVYKWLLQFGLASFSALIIRFEIELSCRLTWAAILSPLIEGFLSNVSLLSRGMVLNATALGFGGWRTLIALKQRLEWHRLVIAILAFIILFSASVLSVNFFRAVSLIYSKDESGISEYGSGIRLNSSSMHVTQSMTSPLFIDRWVGIEGVMAVSSSDRLGWALWREAWSEKFSEGKLSLYDRTFIDTPYDLSSIDKTKHHFISLPGIVAFFYYPGSLGFLFAAMLGCGLFAAGLEVFCYRYCGKNWVLCSLFAQVIAFRYASFGYVPAQSYLLFGSLFLNGALLFAAEIICSRSFDCSRFAGSDELIDEQKNGERNCA